MGDSSITREDVKARARVDALAPVDPAEALKVARKIRHPWYRCQSLSKVAEHWGTKKQRMTVLAEALKSAQSQSDINRIVTVSAWPLRVMATLEQDATAIYLKELVEQANTEPHTLRRADALFAVVSLLDGHPSLQRLVVPALVSALLEGHGGRVDRLIRFTVEKFADGMAEALIQIADHHREGTQKQRMIELLAKKLT